MTQSDIEKLTHLKRNYEWIKKNRDSCKEIRIVDLTRHIFILLEQIKNKY